MKKYINKGKGLIKNPLLMGSVIMVLGSNINNFGQFFYHFISARWLLTTAQYGDLAAIISIIGIFSIIQLSIGLTIVRSIASEKNQSRIFNLTRWFNWWSIAIGIVFTLITLLAAPIISDFLHISEPRSVYLLAPTFLFIIVLFVHRSILQGLLLFNRYVISLLGEMTVKIILTVVLSSLGFAVFGAMVGILFGVIFGFIVTRLSLQKYLSGSRGKRPEVRPLLLYSIPVFLQGVALTSMYSTDLLLVKHFFAPDVAGVYAYLAILGRVALFGIAPITQTMFPLITKRFSHGEPYHKIFYTSTLLIVGITICVVMFYRVFPDLLIGLLGKNEGMEMLWWFGVFMGLLGLASHFTQFYLSVGQTKVVTIFIFAALMQAILILFFHTQLINVIQVSVISAALLVLSLFVYFPYHNSHRKIHNVKA